MAAVDLSTHAGVQGPLNRSAVGTLLALAAVTACGVDGRADLVGRYETSGDGPRETWTFAADGTCAIVRPTTDGPKESRGCEWEYVDREGRTSLVVMVLPPDGGAGTRHRARYVLTPSRFPGGTLTIPLGAGSDRQLRKVE
jgi:hypothetical protein